MRKAINIALWSLFLIGIFVLFSFTEGSKNNGLLQNIVVNVDMDSGNQFVTKNDIRSLIVRQGYDTNKTQMELIDANLIERKIADLSSVEEVEVYKNMNGELNALVKQRKPIVRILHQNGQSNYIDDKGKMMPLSDKYSARVIVVNGYINEKNTFSVNEIKANDSLAKASKLDELYDFVMLFNKDEFFTAQFEQIYIEKNGEYTVIPKVGNQKIYFGKPEDMEQKLNNLKSWYLDGINPENLNLYKTINLKYNGQVVCTKQ